MVLEYKPRSAYWGRWHAYDELKKIEPPHDITNKMTCAPSKDSDKPSLIRVFAVGMKKSWVLSYPLSAQRRRWSDWADAQVDLSLHWAFRSFCHAAAQLIYIIWAASSEFGTYRLCEQRRFRRACASAQSRQNLRCSLIQAVSQEEPSDRKPDPGSSEWLGMHS